VNNLIDPEPCTIVSVIDEVVAFQCKDGQLVMTAEMEMVRGRLEPTSVTISIGNTGPSGLLDRVTATSIRLLPIGYAVEALRDISNGYAWEDRQR
jgi:hypothetical protein